MARCFEIAKLGPLPKRELDFFRSEDMKEDHLMPAMPEMLQGAQQRTKLVKTIRENDDQAAAFELARQLVPERRHRGFPARLGLIQDLQHRSNLFGLGCRRQ